MSVDTKTAIDWQVETFCAFVVKHKRNRYVEKISSPKERKKFVTDLAHWNDLDPRFIVKIAPSSQHPPNIESILRSKGAPEMCRVISEWDVLDDATLPLADALKDVVGCQMGTIICCIPGRLAYFENEDGRCILERKA
jgi:hypothetical protein